MKPFHVAGFLVLAVEGLAGLAYDQPDLLVPVLLAVLIIGGMVAITARL